jgi:hypothetical protein
MPSESRPEETQPASEQVAPRRQRRAAPEGDDIIVTSSEGADPDAKPKRAGWWNRGSAAS